MNWPVRVPTARCIGIQLDRPIVVPDSMADVADEPQSTSIVVAAPGTDGSGVTLFDGALASARYPASSAALMPRAAEADLSVRMVFSRLSGTSFPPRSHPAVGSGWPSPDVDGRCSPARMTQNADRAGTSPGQSPSLSRRADNGARDVSIRVGARNALDPRRRLRRARCGAATWRGETGHQVAVVGYGGAARPACGTRVRRGRRADGSGCCLPGEDITHPRRDAAAYDRRVLAPRLPGRPAQAPAAHRELLGIRSRRTPGSAHRERVRSQGIGPGLRRAVRGQVPD